MHMHLWKEVQNTQSKNEKRKLEIVLDSKISPEADRTIRWKENKYREDLDSSYLLKLIDFYKIQHPTKGEYTFFKNSHRKFTKTEHMLGL